MRVKDRIIFIIIILIEIGTPLVITSVGCTGNRILEEELSVDDAGYYALIIGVEKFLDMNLTQFAHYIEENAIATYELLENSVNWNSSHMKLLLNEDATKKSIRDNITGWLDNLEDEDDVVLIYFSGHGYKIPPSLREKGYAHIVPYDAADWHYCDNVITDKELDSWLDELESNKIVVIIESCYSGRMLSIREEGRVILTAGGKYFLCPVDESEELNHGIFTYFLLKGFSGSADKNLDGWVSAEEVFHYAQFLTFRYSLLYQFPFIKRFNETIYLSPPQLPYMYDQYNGEIKLVKIS